MALEAENDADCCSQEVHGYVRDKRLLIPDNIGVRDDPDPIKNRGGKSRENRSPDQIRSEAEEAGLEVVRIETFLKLDNLYVLKVRGKNN